MSAPSTTAPAPSGAHLRVDGVSLSYAERRVLTAVSFTAAAGERIGLIGENGTGKTTLLRIMAGELEPDAGAATVTMPGGRGVVGLLTQHAPFVDGATVDSALTDAVAETISAATELDQAAAALGLHPDSDELGDRYARALARAEQLDAWTVDARIGEMLDGLSLTHLPRDRPTTELSGGERARLSLACLLLSTPDVLLLDEPTNHLDDRAVGHLVTVLESWRGPVVFAGHDRAFLDDVATRLVDLDPSELPHDVAGPLVGDGDGSGIGVTVFGGGYSAYLDERIAARRRWIERYRAEQDELKELRSRVRAEQVHGHGNRDFASKGVARGSKKFYSDRNAKVVSRRVNDVRSRLEALEESQVRRPPSRMRFGGLEAALDVVPAASGSGGRWHGSSYGGTVLALSEVEVAGRLSPVSVAVAAGEKWLITGPNGCGKSTLLSVIAGLVTPSGGTVNHPRGLRIGLLDQDGPVPDPQGRGPSRTARQAYVDVVGEERAEQVPLATFGLIAGRDENRPVGVLSGGQLRRLKLAAVLANPPDLLLLDEPTNHLSLLLVTELEAGIPEYPGSVIVASHDRWLREHWTGRRLMLARD